ncbi:MAG TPA: hypothetical protein VKQ29_00120 [Aliidongia sp.]|nr:hypothetical protein [Aliidongia sp.]
MQLLLKQLDLLLQRIDLALDGRSLRLGRTGGHDGGTGEGD